MYLHQNECECAKCNYTFRTGAGLEGLHAHQNFSDKTNESLDDNTTVTGFKVFQSFFTEKVLLLFC